MTPQIAHDALDMIEYREAPSILIFTDSEAATTRAAASAKRAGYRVQGVAGIANGLERLGEQIALDAVLVEVDGDQGAVMDRLLDRLNQAAREARHATIVSVPAHMIDAVAARTADPSVYQLVDATDADREEALRLAAQPSRPFLHDVGKGNAPIRLQQLSEEVSRIAGILANLSEEEKDGAAETGAAGVTAQQVRGMIRARRLRDQYFGADLFADPAWDMLLDLMAARLERQRVAVSSLCIAAAVPATTALRWIKTLTEHGLFVRSADPEDGRRVYIELSEGAAAALSAYLRAAQRQSPFLS
ncbi:winged helix DNA-binding protein [Allosphingosinicella flava]|uniref:Winged helix DNA-binding protein n=1 Tax=Allosphingosinicella flava TaxID=2771430 RepID=A0A7T2GLN3_9SPHN|nr:winged helix DNA-binding protein [Sphingosinicella flava]QPQ56097.1 winged helix DNA-binding protein [Sphingosinicella flava]